jgi:hypothetical protein
MTELPDDMEGRLLARLSVLYDDARNGTPVTDPNEHDADELAEIISDLRTLLLAYQERGRVLKNLLDHVDKETCVHENTHRGGTLWTICDDCGRKWADDEGGFVPYKDAPAVAKARAALNQKGKSHD